MQRFVNLRLRSEYSLLSSVLRMSQIVDFAKQAKPLALGLLDESSLSGVFEFSTKLAKIGVKPLLGLNLCISVKDNEEERLSYLSFLAKNEAGYHNLIKLLHKAYFKYPFNSLEQKYIKFEDIAEFSQDLICISGGYNGLFGKYFLQDNISQIKNHLLELKKIFGYDFYIELTRHGRQKEKEFEDLMLSYAFEENIPLVATNDVHFLKKDQFNAFDVLSCIHDGRYIYERDRPRLNEEYYLKSELDMIELFNDIPEAINNTIEIAKKCSFLLLENKPMLPSFTQGDENKENEEFTRQAREGLKNRLKKITVDENLYKERLEFELKVIIKMGFAGYFLIVSDFIKWSKQNGISVGPGRGSGAGSIVSWCLLITNLDPIVYGLIFERFLNPERVSMPDFDIDFCQERRSEVIDYVRKRYGQERVANIITFGKLQAKAALKDVGRVLHVGYNRVDEICKLIPFSPLEPITIEKAVEMDPRLQEARLNDPDIQKLLDTAIELEGLGRHTSTHAAGIIIADRDLTQIAPVYKDLMSDSSVLGLNMKDAEKIGLVKFDFLGLKTLTMIADTCKLVEKHKGIKIDIDDIDLKDAKTFKLLRSGYLKGVFQLEAATPREVLKQISTDKIEDLIAITSLNRPGPMDNIPSFVKRRIGQEKIEYLHPSMAMVLEETLGIIIYQEQVMKIAQDFAGYTLAEADLLRRAMGKKIKEEMDAQRNIFIEGAKKKHNVEQNMASEVFDIVEKFAGYGFNKSHAAAYSVISYQTAFLKAHYPVEFYISILNLDLNNTDKLNELISDAKTNGIKIFPPNINESEALFSISSDNSSIVYGLGALKSIGLEASNTIVEIRKQKNGFKDIFDFARSCGKLANKKTTESAIKAGAFDNLHKNRIALLDNIETIVKYANDYHKSKAESWQDLLFGEAEVINITVPKIANLDLETMTQSDKMTMEFDAIGFYLTSHPLDYYRDKLFAAGIVDSGELEDLLASGEGKKINMAGVVTKIVQRFGKKGRFAFLHLADLSGIYETMIFSDELISSKRDLLIEGTSLIINISAKKEGEAANRMIVNDMFKLEEIIDKTDVLSAMNISNKPDKKYSQQKKNVLIFDNSNEAKKDNSYFEPEINIKNNVLTKDKTDAPEDFLLQKIINNEQFAINLHLLNGNQMKIIYDNFVKLEPDENGVNIILNFGTKKIKLKKRYDSNEIDILIKKIYCFS